MSNSPPNPFVSPSLQSSLPANSLSDEVAEHLRKQHRRAEAMIRSSGLVFCIAAVVLAVMVANAAWTSQSTWIDLRDWPTLLLLALAMGWLTLMGWGMWRLRPWVRIPTLLAAAMALTVFVPLMTKTQGRILVPASLGILITVTLLSRSGRMVLSSNYAAVIRQTRHIHCWELIMLNVVVLVGWLLLSAYLLVPLMRSSHDSPIEQRSVAPVRAP